MCLILFNVRKHLNAETSIDLLMSFINTFRPDLDTTRHENEFDTLRHSVELKTTLATKCYMILTQITRTSHQ